MDLKEFLVEKEISSKLKPAGVFLDKVQSVTKDFVWLDRECQISNNSFVQAQATDYAIFGLDNEPLGRSGNSCYYRYWLREDKKGHACTMNALGKVDSKVDVSATTFGIRPRITIKYEDVENAQILSNSKLCNLKNVLQDGKKVDILEFGEYPQGLVRNDSVCKFLDFHLVNGLITPTGKGYFRGATFSEDGSVIVETCKEYQFRNQKFVLQVVKGKNFWYHVEPIQWEILNYSQYVYDKCMSQISPNYKNATGCLELYATKLLISNLPFYPFASDKNSDIWQNSSIRGYLNGINVCSIQTGGNEKYNAPNGGNFENKGFIDEAFTRCGLMAQNTKSGYGSTCSQKVDKEETASDVAKIFGEGGFKAEEELQSEKQTSKRPTRLQKLNPNKEGGNKREFTDSEIIKSWIDNGESVLLRGPSGIGKTQRIKEMYPNLIYVKLTNNMFPEKVVGSINLQTGEQIPPDYAKQAIMQNATNEEKKLIEKNVQNLYKVADEIYERSKNSSEKTVILLDELLNVKPAVQSLVYTLVLNKLVESGSGLKLPANTVVVATGNQRKYSNVAEDLAEPLEKRFDHILDMKPKVNEWIFEYAIPRKVHPVVISYILSNYFQNRRKNDLQSIQYFYEEPEIGERHLDEFGSKGKTNDPRGWVSLSNALYNFENDVKSGKLEGVNLENILRTYLSSKLRDEWAKDFYEYYNNPTLSVEEVVNERYTNEDLPKEINEKFATIAGLLTAENDEVKKCRNFIKQHCGAEFAKLYDLYWAGNDDDKKVIILDLAMEDKITKEQQEMVEKETEKMQY